MRKKIVLGTHYYPYCTYIKTEVWDLENQKRCQREFQVYFIAIIRRMTRHGHFVYIVYIVIFCIYCNTLYIVYVFVYCNTLYIVYIVIFYIFLLL